MGKEIKNKMKKIAWVLVVVLCFNVFVGDFKGVGRGCPKDSIGSNRGTAKGKPTELLLNL